MRIILIGSNKASLARLIASVRRFNEKIDIIMSDTIDIIKRKDIVITDSTLLTADKFKKLSDTLSGYTSYVINGLKSFCLIELDALKSIENIMSENGFKIQQRHH